MQDRDCSRMRQIAAQNAVRARIDSRTYSRTRTKALEAPAFAPMFVAIGALSLIVAALVTFQSF